MKKCTFCIIWGLFPQNVIFVMRNFKTLDQCFSLLVCRRIIWRLFWTEFRVGRDSGINAAYRPHAAACVVVLFE